jgi:hypothetical protein
MSIAKKSPLSVAAAIVTLVLAGPTFSQASVQAGSVSASAATINPYTDDSCIGVKLCVGSHCMCLGF